jgi:four helix bundle protein
MSSSVNIKAYKFALDVVKFHLNFSKGQLVLINQLLRCATSVGANVEEALGSYSKREFRAKMSIAYKEAREAKYWIRLLNDSGQLPTTDFHKLYAQSDYLCATLYRIVQNTKIK